MCSLKQLQNSYLEWWPFVQGCKFPSISVPCCNSTTCFQAIDPSSPLTSPDSPLDPTSPRTHVNQFYKRKTTLAHLTLLGLIHCPVNVVFLCQTNVHLLSKALLSSSTSASLIPLPGTWGVQQGYFFVSPSIVTSSLAWSAWPFTVQLCEASALSIHPTFSPMSSMNLSFQFKGGGWPPAGTMSPRMLLKPTFCTLGILWW